MGRIIRKRTLLLVLLWQGRTSPKKELETVSIAEPLQNRQHARETPNAVNTRREGEWDGDLKGRREEEGN